LLQALFYCQTRNDLENLPLSNRSGSQPVRLEF